MVITDQNELAKIAKEGGIAVPADINDFELTSHVHFVVFMTVQRGEEMPYPTAALENAKLIASLSDEAIKTTSITDLIDQGLKFGPPSIIV